MIIAGLLILVSLPGIALTAQLEPVTPPDKVLSLAIKHGTDSFPKAEDILAIVHVESFYKEKAKNGPAKGLMQVNRGSFNPDKNVEQGVALLQDLYEKYGSRRKAIVAYNIGEGNLAKRRLLKRGKHYYTKVDFLSKAYAEALGLNEVKE